MTEQLSSEEATNRWVELLSIRSMGRMNSRKRKRSRTQTSDCAGIALPSRGSRKDPFDCSSVKVLPTHEIVEKALDQYLKEWKELDNRKVHRETTAANFSHDDEATTSSVVECGKKTNHGGGWRAMEDRLSLPEGFDYNTRHKEPPLDDGFSGDRVLSLDNPTETLSYHAELWKLFDSVPTCRELEQEARRGHNVSNTLRVYNETHNVKGAFLDDHLLSRLRMPDRHGLPQSPIFVSHYKNNEPQTTLPSFPDSKGQTSHSPTLVFEFWRRQPKKGASSDCNRMVIEFLSSQSLWDVHVVLTQMQEDDLWMASQTDEDPKDEDTSSVDGSILDRGFATALIRSQRKNDAVDQHNPSGCFFIENTFYTTGPVDYAKCITDWIDGSNASNHISLRRRYLGIDPSADLNNYKTMKGTKLGQVPFRLNIRYYHACHGDVETTVLLVDRKLSSQKERKGGSGGISYPLIHDIWTPARYRFPAAPICDACQIYQSVFQTSMNCKTTDGGPRSLCQECCEDLGLLENEKESVKLHRWWRDQGSLSNRIAREHGATF